MANTKTFKKQPKSKKRSKRRLTKTNRSQRRRLQSHWLYLALLAVIGLGLAVNHLLPNSSHHVLGLTTDVSVSTLLAETNQQRLSDHEKPLTLNAQLMQAAQTKANNMVSLDYWSHDTPTGQTPWTFISAAGYNYQSAGENLAYGFTTTQAMMTAWMNSPEHRANILDASYQNIGFGVANATNYQGQGPETLVDVMFGQPAPTSVAAVTGKTTPLSPISSTSLPTISSVSRLQLLTSVGSSWLALMVAALMGALLTILAAKHALKWRRVLVNSEQFIVEHPAIDVSIMVIVMVGFIFSRTAGYIG